MNPFKEIVSSVERYDPVNDQWKFISDMPVPRMVFSATTINDKIYLIGGSTTGLPFTSVGNIDVFMPQNVEE